MDCHVCYKNRISDISNLEIPNIDFFTDIQGNTYNTNVLRDVLSCKRVETLFPNTFVHTVKICRDSVRDSDNLFEFEMNCDSNSRRFIQEMEDMRWKINGIYVDHYRIPDPDLTDKFRKKYLKILINW